MKRTDASYLEMEDNDHPPPPPSLSNILMIVKYPYCQYPTMVCNSLKLLLKQ